MNEAMAGRHWVAVGYSDQEELATVDRKIKDAILISCCYFSGREKMCRIN